ncbi:MAG TPA: hypothetical protein PKY77_26405 [Phycisphaerae bacterium]|nr:hypothetical protein [Phycisphaerae bacterium]HRY70469.1 hypothetical protein [Phycisphaerae bacterium]HSA27703.1 hypothetical protein [Phycisphaerae bacterium]
MTTGACWTVSGLLAATVWAQAAAVSGATATPASVDDCGVWVIVPSGVGAIPEWRYTTEVPIEGWVKPDFGDSAWKTGCGGFGTASTPNTHVRTEWNTKEIWLRQAFALDRAPDGELFLTIHHDEDTEVYLNGILAASIGGYNVGHDLVPVAQEAGDSLRPGRNLIAVHCRQTSGGQYIDIALIRSTLPRWSRGQVQEWYRRQPWPCGFNYVPANAISYTEMFMEYGLDPDLIDEELSLAEDIGFNCMRVVLPFVVWEHDPSAFRKRLDALFGISRRHGIRLMPALFDDCSFGLISDPIYGKQPDVILGWYANGWTPSPGHTLGRDVVQWSRLRRYVQDVIGSFRDDERVLAWDLYNEPINGTSLLTAALVDRVFDWAREVKPAQPLTVGLWCNDADLNRLCLMRSDIVTFHNYGSPEGLEAEIKRLLAFGRPVICTEWLNRPLNSTVAGCLPVFERTGAGCMHWGLVNGRTQTHLGWGWRPGKGEPAQWQHDLYHSDHRPYDPSELSLFRAAIRAKRVAGRAVPAGK